MAAISNGTRWRPWCYLVPGILDSLCRLLVLLDQASKVPAWLHPHGLSIQDLIGLALMEALEQADYQTDAWPCSSALQTVGRVKAVYTHTHWLQGLWNGSSTGKRVQHGTLAPSADVGECSVRLWESQVRFFSQGWNLKSLENKSPWGVLNTSPEGFPISHQRTAGLVSLGVNRTALLLSTYYVPAMLV